MSKSHATKVVKDGSWGAFHFLSFIGAAIYFISMSSGSFSAVVLGLLKAMVWPVFLIYHALRLLGA